MTPRQRDLLALRYLEIETELQWLAEGRVVDGDPAAVEAALVDEQDEIEFKLAADYIEGRNAERIYPSLTCSY